MSTFDTTFTNSNATSPPKGKPKPRRRNKKKKEATKPPGKPPSDQSSSFFSSSIPSVTTADHSLSLSFKQPGQPGHSSWQSAAQDTNMKNQPMVNNIILSNTFKPTFVQRPSILMNQVTRMNFVAPHIFGYVQYDLSRILKNFRRISEELKTTDITRLTFDAESRVNQLVLSSALVNLAIQIQHTMTQDQTKLDPFRSLMHDAPKVHRAYEQLIHTYGAFQCEQGRTVVKYANLLVIQLYHMAVSLTRDIEPGFKERFDYQSSQYVLQMNSPEDYSQCVFMQYPYERDEYVKSHMQHFYERLAANGNIQMQYGEDVYFPFEQLGTVGGLQWALLSADPTILSLSNVLMNINRGTGYDHLLRQVFIIPCEFDQLQLVAEVKLLKQKLNSVLSDQSVDIIDFFPQELTQVAGRWQTLTMQPGSETNMESDFVTTKDDVLYAFMQKSVRTFTKGQKMELNESKTYEDLIEESYSQDVSNKTKK